MTALDRLTRGSRTVALSVAVGLLAGLAAAALEGGLDLAVPRLVGRYGDPGGPHLFRPAALLLFPVLGGVVSGVLLGVFRPQGERRSTEAVIRAFHHEDGRLALVPAAVFALASVAVIACGGSVGPEGPIAGLGAALGSAFVGLFRPTARERRLFLLAGCAGGVGAIFRTPLGGALFAAEIPYRQPGFESDSLFPGIVVSVVAYATFTGLLGYDEPLLRGTGGLAFAHPLELLAYALLGVVCAGAAFLLRASLRSVTALARRARLPRWLAPAAGGLLVGAIALVVPQVMDARYQFVQGALDGTLFHAGARHTWLGWAALFGLVVAAKCLATGCTVGTGNAGGMIGPAVFIGGATGAALGALLEAALPGTIPEGLRQALVPVGMAGVLAASLRAPLASIVMVTEMTGSYGLIVPLMLVSAVAYRLGGRFGLNEEQLASAAESPAHAGEAIVKRLSAWKVGDLADRSWPHVVAPGASLPELVAALAPGTRPTFAVVEGGRLQGLISTGDIARAVELCDPQAPAVAADVMTRSPRVVRADDDLLGTLKLFLAHKVDVLPVVGEDGAEFLGVLDRATILGALQRRAETERDHLIREHAGLRAIAQEQELESLLVGLPATRRRTVQRLPVPGEAAGRSLREADFRRRYACEVIAIETAAGELITPPDPGRPLGADETLIVLPSRPAKEEPPRTPAGAPAGAPDG